MAKDASGIAVGIGCLGLIPALLAAWILKAWAIITLWTWFIYPTWHLATPSKQAAMGLVILFSAISGVESSSNSDPNASAATKIVLVYFRLLGGPILSVFAGWCVRLWL